MKKWIVGSLAALILSTQLTANQSVSNNPMEPQLREIELSMMRHNFGQARAQIHDVMASGIQEYISTAVYNELQILLASAECELGNFTSAETILKGLQAIHLSDNQQIRSCFLQAKIAWQNKDTAKAYRTFMRVEEMLPRRLWLPADQALCAQIALILDDAFDTKLKVARQASIGGETGKALTLYFELLSAINDKEVPQVTDEEAVRAHTRQITLLLSETLISANCFEEAVAWLEGIQPVQPAEHDSLEKRRRGLLQLAKGRAAQDQVTLDQQT